MLAWLPVAIAFLEPAQIISSLAVAAIGAVLSVFVLRRRIFAAIQVYELEQRVVTLESILPMCANCKKTRDHSGKWKTIEKYIEDNQSGTQISHGSCPSCTKELHEEFYKKRTARVGERN